MVFNPLCLWIPLLFFWDVTKQSQDFPCGVLCWNFNWLQQAIYWWNNPPFLWCHKTSFFYEIDNKKPPVKAVANEANAGTGLYGKYGNSNPYHGSPRGSLRGSHTPIAGFKSVLRGTE
jgi:hypothetical protein